MAQGVTLKCTKIQEVVRYFTLLYNVLFDICLVEASYFENHGRMKSQRFLPTFCKEVPTHAIFGTIGDVKCGLISL